MISLESCENLEKGRKRFLKDVFDENLPILPDFNEAFNIVVTKRIISISERNIDIFIMYYFQGKTCREIGEIEGISAQRVSELVHRVLRRFRSKVCKMYFTHGVDYAETKLENIKNVSTEIKTFETLGLSVNSILGLEKNGIKDMQSLYSELLSIIHSFGVSEEDALKLFNLNSVEISDIVESAECSVPIEMLGLSCRTYNSLMRNGYRTVESIRGLKRKDFLKIRNMGNKGIDELVQRCKDFGIELEV